MKLQTGSSIGGYRLGALLGDGQDATTWRAVHLETGADRTFKLIHDKDPVFLERIRRAAEAQRKLAHPNLVHVDEVLDAGGHPAVVMEYVPGGTLEAWMAERKPLGAALAVFEQLARGVSAAHRGGVVHRNLKPAKILLDATRGAPIAKVNDFTLVKLDDAGAGAQLTQMGMSFGTPQYMAPEQFRDAHAVDARADVFALGAILFELVTGRRAFDGKNLMDIYMKSAQGDFPEPRTLVPELPESVARAVSHALAPKPEARTKDVDALLQELFASPGVEALVAPHRPRAKEPEAPPATESLDLDLEEKPRPAMPMWMIAAMAVAFVLVVFAGIWGALA